MLYRPSTARSALMIPRYFASHAKRRVRTIVTPVPDTAAVVLEGVARNGKKVRLRRPVMGDAAAWRAEMLANQSDLEPYWTESDVAWAERLTDLDWVHECLDWRRRTRSGAAFPSVVEVDGRFAGQCNLEWIDSFNKTAEAGTWISKDVAGGGVAHLAMSLLVDFALGDLGLERVTAPIHVSNERARYVANQIGFVHEGTLRNYSPTPGGRSDHCLYAIVPSDRIGAGRRSSARDVDK